MKYWIIIDDRHAGPFSAQQLLDTGLTADTLVWHEGLPDWTRAANIAELAEGLQCRAMAEAEARERLVAEAEARRIAEEEARRMEAEAERMRSEEPAQSVPQWEQTVEPVYTEPAVAQPQNQAQPITEPCPPAYIAWSIIATLLCCTIVGIPGIIFASMTKSAYYKGDLAKAKRYSELAQWFIIASIVLGAISWPFQIAIMGMFQ